jgi:phosphate transport system protein
VFKGLFSWWKEDVLLKSALEQSGQAIDKAGRMFSLGMAVVTEGTDIAKTIFDMDKELNSIQIDIRKKVLEHLAINPAQDVTSSLILITIIIDIERVGDLAKNLVEIQLMSRGALDEPAYASDIKTMREKLEASFITVRKAFLEGNDDKANQVMGDCTWIGTRCDATIQVIAGDEELEVREAVAYTLLFYYLKRISSHIRNIASSVVNPFHKLGYKPE